MRVIAEGVETAQQRDLLASVDCDYVQGYLYAKPMVASEFEDYMAAYRASAQTQLSLSGS